MRRPRNACTIISTLALIAAAGCTQEAEAPPTAPVEPVPAPVRPAGTPISYACESGQSVTVGYPDTATAQLTYKGQTYVLRTVQAASGARFTGSGMEWQTVTAAGQESATLSRLGPNQDVGVAVLERCSRPSSGAGRARPCSGARRPAGRAIAARGRALQGTAAQAVGGRRRRRDGTPGHHRRRAECRRPGLQLDRLSDGDAAGRARPQPDDHPLRTRTPNTYLRSGQSPAPVTLQPQSKAFFDLAWTVVPNEGQGETTCPTAARIRAVAPGRHLARDPGPDLHPLRRPDPDQSVPRGRRTGSHAAA